MNPKDTIVAALLNTFLGEELSAWYTYWMLYQVMKGTAYKASSKVFEENAEDELNDHAVKLITWMQANNIPVVTDISKLISYAKGGSSIPPDMKDGWSTMNSVIAAIKSERHAIQGYRNGYKQVVDDYPDLAHLFMDISNDEEEHLNDLLDLAGQIGIDSSIIEGTGVSGLSNFSKFGTLDKYEEDLNDFINAIDEGEGWISKDDVMRQWNSFKKSHNDIQYNSKWHNGISEEKYIIQTLKDWDLLGDENFTKEGEALRQHQKSYGPKSGLTNQQIIQRNDLLDAAREKSHMIENTIAKMSFSERIQSCINKINNFSEDKDWVNDVETKWEPPEGLFESGSADEIAKEEKKGHKDLKSAMASLNFYLNRGGDNIPEDRRKVIEEAKEKLRDLYNKE